MTTHVDSKTTALLGEIAQMGAELFVCEPPFPMELFRRNLADIFLRFGGENARGVAVRNFSIPGKQRPIPARMFQPSTVSGRSPLIVFLHGGGWSLGDLDCYAPTARRLAAAASARVLAVDYRLAPEHKFPAGLEDCLQALRWVVRHSASLDADPRRIAVAGDSAGGQLAAVCAQELCAERGPILAAVALLYPMTDVSSPHSAYRSRVDHGDGDLFLSRDGIDLAADWLLRPSDDRTDPRISPLHAKDFVGLPSTLVHVAGLDPLRDEGIAYAEKLRLAGVPVDVQEQPGAIHAYLSLGVLDQYATGWASIGSWFRARFARKERGWLKWG